MESIEQLAEPKKPSPFQNLFLARGYYTGTNHWWAYLSGVAFTIFGYFAYQIVMMIPIVISAEAHGTSYTELAKHPEMIMNPDAIGMNRSLFLALIAGIFVFALLGLNLALRRLHHKPLRSVITGYERIRWKRYFFAFAVWGLLIVAIQLIGYFMDPTSVEINFEPSRFGLLLLVSVVFIPIQTATEEIFFRGYLLQGFGLMTRNGLAPLFITSILFGLVHSQNPETETFGFWVMMPYYMLFALFLGFITLLDEGLELAMGIHCANNLISSLLVTSKSSVLQTDAIFTAKTEDPGAEMLLWLVLAAICFAVFYMRYRWKNWKHIIR